MHLKPEMDALAGLPISFRLGGEETSWLDGMDYVVPSPGVPMDNLCCEKPWRDKFPC